MSIFDLYRFHFCFIKLLYYSNIFPVFQAVSYCLIHCPKIKMNLGIKTEPVTAGEDATGTYIWQISHTYVYHCICSNRQARLICRDSVQFWDSVHILSLLEDGALSPPPASSPAPPSQCRWAASPCSSASAGTPSLLPRRCLNELFLLFKEDCLNSRTNFSCKTFIYLLYVFDEFTWQYSLPWISRFSWLLTLATLVIYFQLFSVF